MKKVILIVLISIVLCAFTTKAQVSTTYFEGKDAFNSLLALRHSKVQELAAKKMPPVDVERLLKEDSEMEGMDIPYRFGYGFDVNYMANIGF